MAQLKLNDALSQAIALHASGNLTGAEELYRAVLNAAPDHPIALNHLGMIAHRLGKQDEAIRLFDKAIAIAPDAQSFNNRGHVLRALGRHEEALASYDRALAIKPDYAVAIKNRGLVLQDLGRNDLAILCFDQFLAIEPNNTEVLNCRGRAQYSLHRRDDALVSYERALAIDPGLADAINNCGVILDELGRHEEAVLKFDSALAVQERFAEALNNRGRALIALKRHEEALESFDRALTIRSDYVIALNNRAQVLLELKRHQEAIEGSDRVLNLEPDNIVALRIRGNILQAMHRYDEALLIYDRILAINGYDVGALNDRGLVLSKLNRQEEAFAAFNKAFSLQPNSIRILCNRGNALVEMSRYLEAMESFGKIFTQAGDFARALTYRGLALMSQRRIADALADFTAAQTIDPSYARAHWSEALCRLLLGDFWRGFEKYEWRFKVDDFDAVDREFKEPRWTGRQDLANKKILLHGEQGLGDTIQFCRYAELVAARGGHVILEVDGMLAALMRSLDGVGQIIERGATLPDFEFHCPIMSLPLAMQTRLTSIPSKSSYLQASPDCAAKWKDRLGGAGLKVGVVWAGNPNNKDEFTRSIALKKLSAIFGIEGIRYFALQNEFRPGDKELLGSIKNIENLGPELADVSDTAAVVASLDLVISSDTSIVHLAGALGRPVWIALKYVPDWRWMLDRRDSPWYPTARLFRQPRVDDWDSVVRQIAEKLRSLAGAPVFRPLD